MADVAALRRGRERAYKARCRESLRRVKQYQEWLDGKRKLPLPLGIPDNNDYARVRAQGRG